MPKEDAQGMAPAPPAAGGITVNGPLAPLSGCTCQPTGRLLDVRRDGHERLVLTERLAWLESALTEIVSGGVYLVSGAPGSRKSGLVTQLALDFGVRGVRALDPDRGSTPAVAGPGREDDQRLAAG